MKFNSKKSNSAHRIEKPSEFNEINDFVNSERHRIERPSKLTIGAILRGPYIRDTHPLRMGRGVGYQEGEGKDIFPTLKKMVKKIRKGRWI